MHGSPYHQVECDYAVDTEIIQLLMSDRAGTTTASAVRQSTKTVLSVTVPLSFHPISNLSFLSKIVECVVARQFIRHADQYSLPTRQSANRQFHSMETTVIVVHNDVVAAIDQGHVADLALLDLSSAFDTVDHTTQLAYHSKIQILSCRSTLGVVPLIPQ